ncbi:MAG: T9SS type A sorting domain-containing protein [Bacteroidales bacterium]|nr:T9SS type A sorting domain-containing protein [Bacteroidales bacterium]
MGQQRRRHLQLRKADHRKQCHQLFAKQAPLTSHLSSLTSPGVYVLRLTNGEGVKTQKLMVR